MTLAAETMTWLSVPDDLLITRTEIAEMCDVKPNTVRIWAQYDGFPNGVHVRGFRPVYHHAGEIRRWLCATGRLDCGDFIGTLTLEQVLERTGAAPSTLRAWRAAGRFPEPDYRVQDKPLWKAETIDEWEKGHRPAEEAS